MKLVQLAQGTEDWLAWRRGGVGGSDAPVVMGNSPYRTLRQLYQEKKGLHLVDESEDKEFIFAKGHQTEGLIRNQFQERTGVIMDPICVQHSKITHLRASLDGFDSKLGVLEAKLVGQAVIEKASESGEIPGHHYTQIQHNCAVTGSDLAHWFGHDGKKRGVLIEVKADKKYIRALKEQESKFWEMVQSGQVPPLSDQDYLIPEDTKLLEELRDAKEHAENASAYFEIIKRKAIETYKHSRIAGAGLKIFQVKRAGAINLRDVPEIKALSVEYLEQFRGQGTTSWTVAIDRPKKKGSE